jgi:phosphatidylethanolamine/phosphatidyl-N-methylethanolamine N-methyltransferase
MATTDYKTFVRTWATEPVRTGAILPSGDALSRLITSEITRNTGQILELGAGTGVFTKMLLSKGVREDDLTLVETAPEFGRLLQLRFPRTRVLAADARALLDDRLYEGRTLGAVISGLPLLSFSSFDVADIIMGAFTYLKPSGNFYQFTYGLKSPVPRAVLDFFGLEAKRIGWTLRNLPPAAVYRISRKAHA